MKKDIILLHIAVFLFGLSGLFGKLISSPAEIIVSGRVISATIFIYIVLKIKKEKIELFSPESLKIIGVQGTLLFLHWFSFFQSIKLSTVALGLLSFSTFPVFTTFMEPLFLRLPLDKKKVVIALVTLMGVAVVAPIGNMDSHMTRGILLGIFSGFSFALLAVINKKLSVVTSGIKLTFYQCFGASLCSIPVLLSNISTLPSGRELGLLISLGVIFTGIAHTLFVSSLRSVSASTVSVTTCLEPVYGIAFAAVILGEIPTMKIFLGCSLILMAAFSSARIEE